MLKHLRLNLKTKRCKFSKGSVVVKNLKYSVERTCSRRAQAGRPWNSSQSTNIPNHQRGHLTIPGRTSRVGRLQYQKSVPKKLFLKEQKIQVILFANTRLRLFGDASTPTLQCSLRLNRRHMMYKWSSGCLKWSVEGGRLIMVVQVMLEANLKSNKTISTRS